MPIPHRKSINCKIFIQFMKQHMSFLDRDIMNTANLVINDILKIMKIGEKMENIAETEKNEQSHVDHQS